ncbi:MAG: hypothetical protein IID32_00275 [Planctomycetes bacterium]|nr:hypothetical protein [Planctomycetota bacterium]
MIAQEDKEKPQPTVVDVVRRGPGNPNWIVNGVGVSGNPAGSKPARTNLYRHICRFVAMSDDELKQFKDDNVKILTQSQKAALKIVDRLANGSYTIGRDFIERDEGKVPLSINMNVSVISNQIASMDEAQVNERLMEVSRMIGLEHKLLEEGDKA